MNHHPAGRPDAEAAGWGYACISECRSINQPSCPLRPLKSLTVPRALVSTGLTMANVCMPRDAIHLQRRSGDRTVAGP